MRRSGSQKSDFIKIYRLYISMWKETFMFYCYIRVRKIISLQQEYLFRVHYDNTVNLSRKKIYYLGLVKNSLFYKKYLLFLQSVFNCHILCLPLKQNEFFSILLASIERFTFVTLVSPFYSVRLTLDIS